MKSRWLPATILLVTALLAGALVAHDVRVPVRRQLSTRGAIFMIEEYRQHISPRLRGRVECRFQPTCSAYGLGAVRKYGAVRGGWRAVKRIARCTPWTPRGTVDLP